MKICIFGSGSSNIDSSYKKIGKDLGQLIAKRQHQLVFGGGSYGMMGAVVKGVIENNGKVIGVAPDFLTYEHYDKCSEFIETETIYERKKILRDLSGGFIVTPGGLGTLDEFFEVLTLKKLERHNKPIVILNINNYFNEMLNMISISIGKKFIPKENAELYKVVNSPEEALNYLENY